MIKMKFQLEFEIEIEEIVRIFIIFYLRYSIYSVERRKKMVCFSYNGMDCCDIDTMREAMKILF